MIISQRLCTRLNTTKGLIPKLVAVMPDTRKAINILKRHGFQYNDAERGALYIRDYMSMTTKRGEKK